MLVTISGVVRREIEVVTAYFISRITEEVNAVTRRISKDQCNSMPARLLFYELAKSGWINHKTNHHPGKTGPGC